MHSSGYRITKGHAGGHGGTGIERSPEQGHAHAGAGALEHRERALKQWLDAAGRADKRSSAVAPRQLVGASTGCTAAVRPWRWEERSTDSDEGRTQTENGG
jgi:hypothetical protein